MSKPKLKPCPFCGTPASVTDKYEGRDGLYEILCPSLSCRVVARIVMQDNDRGRRIANRAWNTRRKPRKVKR